MFCLEENLLKTTNKITRMYLFMGDNVYRYDNEVHITPAIYDKNNPY